MTRLYAERRPLVSTSFELTETTAPLISGARNAPIRILLPRDILHPGVTLDTILWIHGKGGTREDYPWLVERWSSYGGYAVLQPDMRDSPNVDLDEEGNDWEIRYAETKEIAARAASLLAPLGVYLGKFAVGGHSWGSRCADVANGQLVRSSLDLLVPNSIGGLCLSPAGEDNTTRPDPWATQCRPMFYLTGDKDGQGDVWVSRCEPFENTTAPTFLSVYVGGDHGHGYPFKKGRTHEPQTEITDDMTLAFWDYLFTSSSDAYSWLSEGMWERNQPAKFKIYNTRNLPADGSLPASPFVPPAIPPYDGAGGSTRQPLY